MYIQKIYEAKQYTRSKSINLLHLKKVLFLVEKSDFSKGTSSRSTKLVHGGVRYMQNGDISLVIEALKERGILKKNAPHLVKNMSFVIF